jgi:hypothetical protein
MYHVNVIWEWKNLFRNFQMHNHNFEMAKLHMTYETDV